MKHGYNVGGSEDYRLVYDSGFSRGWCQGITECAAGIWQSMDESPPENETLLVKLKFEDGSTSVYVAIKYGKDNYMAGRWQIYPDDEDQLRDDDGKYPIIEWARIQNKDGETA